jgi:small-conductance mechanosensitive channel
MNEYITDLLRRWHLSPAIWNIILLAGAILLGLILRILLGLFFKKKAEESGRFSFFNSFFYHVGQPLGYLLPLFWLAMLLPIFRLDAIIKTRVERAIGIAIIIISAWLLIRCVKVIQDYVLHLFNFKKADNLRERRIITQLQFIRRLLVSFIILMAVAAVLLSFPAFRRLGTGLLTGVGIGGIIVGFAAQRSLGNLLAGFQIAFTQPIRIDDEVVVEGEFGWIEEITLTYVVVRVWDERRLILPINYFIEKPFQNWTRKSAEIHGTVFLYTDYNIPIDALRAEYDRLVNNHPLWDKRSSSLVVTDATDRVIQLRGVVSAKNSGDLFTLRCHLREHLIKFITLHYPQYLPQTRAYVEGALGSISKEGEVAPNEPANKA